MSFIGFLVLLLIAAVCGAIGQGLSGFSLGGCLVSIIVGFVGAYIGLWVADQFDLPTFFVINIDGRPFPIIWSIIGSALLSAVLGLIFRGLAGRPRRVP